MRIAFGSAPKLRAFASAPLLSKASTSFLRPAKAARWRGVAPSEGARPDGSKPKRSISCAAHMCAPCAHATCNMESPDAQSCAALLKAAGALLPNLNAMFVQSSRNCTLCKSEGPMPVSAATKADASSARRALQAADNLAAALLGTGSALGCRVGKLDGRGCWGAFGGGGGGRPEFAWSRARCCWAWMRESTAAKCWRSGTSRA
mmetsp:Transcript_18026/g.51422  ORF Transcript_18026/g.51422 Transcript_18026/m.51422 type:complete len:204 (+) Transcript_18026:994-1605(+)